MTGPPIMTNDTVRLARQLLGFSTGPGSEVPNITGPNEVSEQEMAALANVQTLSPSAIIARDGVQAIPDLVSLYRQLPKRAILYERRYLLRGHKRWDFTIAGNTGVAVTQIAPDEIPQGALAFIQQIDVMQLANGGVPDSVAFYVTDVGNSNGTPAQLYTSGVNQYTGGDKRTFIPGGIRPMFTFVNTTTGHNYLVQMQWMEVGVLDVPEFDLSQLFGHKTDGSFLYGVEEATAPDPDSADAIFHSLDYGGTGQGDF